VSANVINAVANWILIYGRLGAPALGATGAAWATLASRIYMAIVLVVAVVVHDTRHRTGLFRIKPVIERERRARWSARAAIAAVVASAAATAGETRGGGTELLSSKIDGAGATAASRSASRDMAATPTF